MSKEDLSYLSGKRQSSARIIGSDIGNALISTETPLELFSVAWAITCFVYLILTPPQLRKVTKGNPRRPFILLTIITGLLGIGYVALSFEIWLSRKHQSNTDMTNTLSFIFEFAYYTNIALLPAVWLYYLHLRANALRTSQGGKFNSLMTQRWKKMSDWGLIGLLYFLHMLYFDLNFRRINGYNHGKLDEEAAEKLRLRAVHVYNVILALKVTTYLDVMISNVMMVVQAENQNIFDPVIRHLLSKGFPQFLILFGVALTSHIIGSTSPSARNSWLLIDIFSYGYCYLFIGAAVTYTADLGTIDRVKERV
ncbi:hypothetical protein CPB86DRAFT_826123 [Serendipita vermifera]|nr:hypothetical protein CPB86DRAFT_826123 [Serendipita vermifera]